ncbi:hypothetical protein F4781DRAFT_234401 [Annulohypoxylon bovei var. microspora]|nr:hypothetical protein F4781DRAFT_234401 [Annulohypoxylon bovei var. microspora]
MLSVIGTGKVRITWKFVWSCIRTYVLPDAGIILIQGSKDIPVFTCTGHLRNKRSAIYRSVPVFVLNWLLKVKCYIQMFSNKSKFTIEKLAEIFTILFTILCLFSLLVSAHTYRRELMS